ncbi:lipoyl(octanoyl) transferase [Desulfonatronum thiosulfatophilum]|uniref:Octanoyltransferase n=1 Tax=Desulfonatronum thiosulfatophilum TaxID=617002 RepID=A0A1G6BX18_9BACT|nr:lipoyl(octanoyl) transferase LipB [Desulfonatronum thiosulfatophilum]SDB25186.1 lipoyl(octanoyl) transferase [Desulfonatronum thiosulfatophilum]
MIVPRDSHNSALLPVHDLGMTPYRRALDIQRKAVQEVIADEPQRLLVAEHPPVITLGRNSGLEHLHVSSDYLVEKGIELVQTSRGGGITCHFPGQLVIYPILRMDRRPGGLRQLVRDLEDAAIHALRELGLAARRVQDRPGVWIGARKVASIGLALKNWVSYHGLALNVCRDTSLFNLITPCGLKDVQATSVHTELNREEPDMATMKHCLLEHLGKL